LFELREKYLEQDNTLSSLADNLGIQTTAVLQQTQRLRSDTRTIVNSLAQQTVQDLQQYRIFLVLVSTLVLLALALLSYWLVYRKTVLPLIGITRQLDDVGKVDFPQTAERYFLAELSSLSPRSKCRSRTCS
jgi:methyl-accepting chemotaxis protein